MISRLNRVAPGHAGDGTGHRPARTPLDPPVDGPGPGTRTPSPGFQVQIDGQRVASRRDFYSGTGPVVSGPDQIRRQAGHSHRHHAAPRTPAFVSRRATHPPGATRNAGHNEPLHIRVTSYLPPPCPAGMSVRTAWTTQPSARHRRRSASSAGAPRRCQQPAVSVALATTVRSHRTLSESHRRPTDCTSSHRRSSTQIRALHPRPRDRGRHFTGTGWTVARSSRSKEQPPSRRFSEAVPHAGRCRAAYAAAAAPTSPRQ